MVNNYTQALDREIGSWLSKRDAIKKDPNFFENEIQGVKMFKTQARQSFTLPEIQGRISGLIEAKALYYEKQRQSQKSRT